MPEKNNAASDWNPTAAANKCDAIVTQAVANVEIFDNDEFGQLRAVKDGDEILFRAIDVAKALGYRDAERLTRRLPDDEKATRLVGTHGGNQSASFVTEPGFYRAVMARRSSYVNDYACRESVDRFQRWVTHEVLPAIRRDGGYMAAAPEETPEQTMARALLIAQRTIERAKAEEIDRSRTADSIPKTISSACVVTWFNPQALIDGTMMLGAFYVTLPAAQSTSFISGVALASCLWFTGLTLLISLFSDNFTPKTLVVINKVCGVIIVFYGCKLLYSFLTMVF